MPTVKCTRRIERGRARNGSGFSVEASDDKFSPVVEHGREVENAESETALGPRAPNTATRSGMRISLFASNPLSSSRLALGEEVRLLEDTLRVAKHRDFVSLRTHWAVRPADLQQALLEDDPTVVHFSGHGTCSGIVFHSSVQDVEVCVPENALVELFRTLKGSIRVVVLNACYSEVQAQAIVQAVDIVVGMSDVIDDEAARIFAAALYRGLAFGKSVQTAFNLGLNALSLAGLSDVSTPRLLVRRGVDASQIFLVVPYTDVLPCTPARQSSAHRRRDYPRSQPNTSKVASERLEVHQRPCFQVAGSRGVMTSIVTAVGLLVWSELTDRVRWSW